MPSRCMVSVRRVDRGFLNMLSKFRRPALTERVAAAVDAATRVQQTIHLAAAAESRAGPVRPGDASALARPRSIRLGASASPRPRPPRNIHVAAAAPPRLVAERTRDRSNSGLRRARVSAAVPGLLQISRRLGDEGPVRALRGRVDARHETRRRLRRPPGGHGRHRLYRRPAPKSSVSERSCSGRLDGISASRPRRRRDL